MPKRKINNNLAALSAVLTKALNTPSDYEKKLEKILEEEDRLRKSIRTYLLRNFETTPAQVDEYLEGHGIDEKDLEELKAFREKVGKMNLFLSHDED
jgi:hypothetical protein